MIERMLSKLSNSATKSRAELYKSAAEIEAAKSRCHSLSVYSIISYEVVCFTLLVCTHVELVCSIPPVECLDSNSS